MAGEDDRRHVFSLLERRFGISESLFDGYHLFKRKRSWWLLRDTSLLQSASRLKVSGIGLRAFQRVGKYLKPSTRMIQMFGHHATKASIEMDEVQLHNLVGGNPVNAQLDMEDGYVILSFEGCILGLGLYIDGRIHSQIPRKEFSLS